MITALLLVATLAAEPVAASAPPQPAPAATVLHLDEALKIALAAQPSVRQAHAQTAAAEARALEARAPLLPQIGANLGYARATANSTAANSVLKPGNNSFDSYNSLIAGVSASQLVWDFGQTTGRWRAAKSQAEAQVDNEKASLLLTALSVRAAYFGARGAKALLEVAVETTQNLKRHLEQAQGFFEVGTKPKLDVVQAQSDLATAQVQLIQADNAYRTSKVQLNQALGREGPGDFEVGEDSLPPVAGEELGFAALMDEAVKARPEIAQLEAQIRAQESTLGSVRGAYWPTLGVAASFNAGGQDFTAFGWNWNLQTTLTWPLFQGLLTQSQEQEANATLDAIKAQRDGLRQQVALELEQARLAVEADKSALAAADDAVKLAHERLDLAEGRYQTGAGSIIELTDAQTAYTNASGQRVKSEYDLAVARAQLLKALGRP